MHGDNGSSMPMGGGISGIPSHAQSLLHSSPLGRPRSHSAQLPSSPLVSSADKPLASSNGGAVSMSIIMTEPVLFLRGFEPPSELAERSSAMLRGSLVVKVSKATKIKNITLSFKGRARTEWPEGIPPRKSEFCEEKELMTHVWPFFNSSFPTAEIGSCADSVRLERPSVGHNADSNVSTSSMGSIGSALSMASRNSSPVRRSSNMHSEKRLSLGSVQSRSFGKGDTHKDSVAVKGYRVFQPGEYVYNFELPIESCLPETINVELGSVKYELEAVLERHGAFRPKLVGKKEVIMIRCPSDHSLEAVEPIAISRNWEDQMHYDIVISGKSFPLGSKIPIAFKLTPLAKVKCHRVKIFITENIEYSCKGRRIHRIDPTKKILLYEKRADGTDTQTFPGSTSTFVSGGGIGRSSNSGSPNGSVAADNLMGDLSGAENVGPTEMEFNVQLPGCGVKEKDRLHFDTTYKDIQVHHWIKIVMRLSKADPNDPSKRRHFEISIDSPFHILSCRANPANISLPAYTDRRPDGPTPVAGHCTCPSLSRRATSKDSTVTTVTHIPPTISAANSHNPAFDRPMHLIRLPSTNPPAFDADTLPPPFMTPPPNYEAVVGSSASNALADYFSRLAAAEEETDEESCGGDLGVRPSRRNMPPLTPGGRVNRSMDEQRNWAPIVGTQ